VTETKIGPRKTIYVVDHPRNHTLVRLFVVQGGKIEEVTKYVAKITKLKLKRKWLDAGTGANPGCRTVAIFAAVAGRESQPYHNLY
jgi:hypothetical protein